MDILIVLVVVLIIVLVWRGPKVLPEWGAAVGKSIREVRVHATKGLDSGEEKQEAIGDGTLNDASQAVPQADTTNAPRT